MEQAVYGAREPITFYRDQVGVQRRDQGRTGQKHLGELKASLDAFVDRDPYGVLAKVDNEKRLTH